jgi:hypothetical protein
MSPPDLRAETQHFFELLQTIHKGEALLDILDSMRQAIKASKDRNKPSEVTIKLGFTPAGDDDAIYISVRSSVKLPPVQRGQSTWFVWSDGMAHIGRENQRGLFDDNSPRLVSGTVIRPGESDAEAERAERAAPAADPFADDRRLAQ